MVEKDKSSFRLHSSLILSLQPPTKVSAVPQPSQVQQVFRSVFVFIKCCSLFVLYFNQYINVFLKVMRAFMQPVSSKPIYTEVSCILKMFNSFLRTLMDFLNSLFMFVYVNCLFISQNKPLPPSRPLPPLASKPVSDMTFYWKSSCLHSHI